MLQKNNFRYLLNVGERIPIFATNYPEKFYYGMERGWEIQQVVNIV
jgi:hypothetical protein